MTRIANVLLAALALAPACGNDVVGGEGNGTGTGSGSADEWEQLLAQRVVDYSAALRIAALRLAGDLPSRAEIERLAIAADDQKPAVYAGLVRDYLGRPGFARQMFGFWRDTFRMGGTPETDTAPAFAAKLAVDNASYMELFTRATNTCPRFDEATAAFTAGECTNGGPRAGVLTDPGMNAQYASSMAFRRVRWVQEIFACARFPAELGSVPADVGGVLPYRGVWPFDSIASPASGGRIDFHDVSSSMCAECHATMNHIAPLFARYDERGAYQADIAVALPLGGGPATLADFLPAGEATAWRYQQPAVDLPALGARMAADPDVAACGVARLWSFAFGHLDIVDARREVPRAVIQDRLDAFAQGGFKIQDLLFAIFTSEDFVRF